MTEGFQRRAHRGEECIHHAIGGKCTSRGGDRTISALAERQHGLVARRQLLALDIGKRAIEERLKRGRLHRIHRGVYAVGHMRLSIEARWLAAVLASGPDSVLSHRAAGRLWGLTRDSSAHREVTRPGYFRGQSSIVAHRSSLPDDEKTVVEGIPVTTVPRTLLDLATVVSRRQLERARNEAEVLGLTDGLSVPDLLKRYPRRPGSAVLRELLRDEAAPTGITQNDFEEDFVALLDAHHLPRPRFNADIMVRDRHFNVDCLWRERRLIVELDGREVHGTTRAFETDRERDRLLLADGWRVMRLTWHQVHGDPTEIVADLRMLLEDRQVRARRLSEAPTL